MTTKISGILCDIDGTINVKPKHVKDFKDVEVSPIEGVVSFIRTMSQMVPIWFFSKRPLTISYETSILIRDIFGYRFEFAGLLLRPEYIESKGRSTCDVKFDIFEHYRVDATKILMYVEDDIPTILKFRNVGINAVHPCFFKSFEKKSYDDLSLMDKFNTLNQVEGKYRVK